MEAGHLDHEKRVNHASPAHESAKVGTVIVELLAAYNDLSAKYRALLLHLDTANVGGIGNGNAAAYALVTPTLRALGDR
ncbi:MAG TPA: hypothetical protein VGC15_16585 [Acetobacteraceae bacterium]